MRVLALTNLYPTPFQPHRAPFNRQQLRALSARHEVAVIAPVAWTDELTMGRKAGTRVPPSRRVTRDGITVHHPRYLFPPKVLRGWYGHFFRQSVGPTFRRVLREFRPDVLLAAWAYPDGWAGVELAREAGIRVVVKVHGSDVLLVGPGSARRRRTVDALGRADHVVAVSRDLRDKVVAMGVDSSKVSVVYCGVDTRLFRPGSRDDARGRLGLGVTAPPLLLFVGNLLPVKGLDVLIDACDRLHRNGVDFDCRIIGRGPMRARLERQIRRRRLSGRVHLMGPRPLEQLPDWYRAANLFVLPSRSEGVPNVLLEATACGTPVVATRVGGVPEVRGLCPAALVPPGDPAALAGAIESALRRGEPPAAEPLRPLSWDESAAFLADTLKGSD